MTDGVLQELAVALHEVGVHGAAGRRVLAESVERATTGGIVDDLDWDCHASRKGVRGHDLVRRREEYSAAVVIQQG